MCESDWQIYAKQMFPLAHGFPLWQPAPLADYDRIEIGDVGYVQDGQFKLLFKAAQPLGDRRLGVDVPPDFEPLDIGLVDHSEPRLPQTCLHTASVRTLGASATAAVDPIHPANIRASFSFETSDAGGAALVTNCETYVANARQKRRFTRYLKQHARSWARWARQEDHDVGVDDIRLVTGHDLTGDFAMFAYHGDQQHRLTAEFRVALPGATSASASVWGAWTLDRSAHYNYGPQRRVPPVPTGVEPRRDRPPVGYNQCVFFRSYRIMYRAGLWPQVLRAGAGPHVFAPQRDDDFPASPVPASDMTSSEDDIHIGSDSEEELRSRPYAPGEDTDDEAGSSEIVCDTPSWDDPGRSVFNYIFQRCPGADAALVHDLDIAQILQATSKTHVEEITAALEALQPEVYMDDQRTASIVLVSSAVPPINPRTADSADSAAHSPTSPSTLPRFTTGTTLNEDNERRIPGQKPAMIRTAAVSSGMISKMRAMGTRPHVVPKTTGGEDEERVGYYFVPRYWTGPEPEARPMKIFMAGSIQQNFSGSTSASLNVPRLHPSSLPVHSVARKTRKKPYTRTDPAAHYYLSSSDRQVRMLTDVKRAWNEVSPMVIDDGEDDEPEPLSFNHPPESQSAYFIASAYSQPMNEYAFSSARSSTAFSARSSSVLSYARSSTAFSARSNSVFSYARSSTAFSPEPVDVDAFSSSTIVSSDLGTSKVACQRCKDLKVKCEYNVPRSEICKRCHNGGNDCYAPGKKKRKQPPKRGDLLHQIQEQASHIQRLMAQLEAQQHPRALDISDQLPSLSISATAPPDARTQDWIANARAHFERFGGHIGMGVAGAGAAQDLLVAEDPEDAGSEGYEIVDGSEYGIDVEAESDASGEGGRGFGVRRLSRGSANSSEGEERRMPGQKLATIPTEAAPFGLIWKMKTRPAMGRSLPGSPETAGGEDEVDERVGIANDDYFRPSPEPEARPVENAIPGTIAVPQHQIPHVLEKRIVTPEEVEKLFAIYFDYMNLSLSLLDPVIYTAKNTYWRSPFLFTVICAVASRYHTVRPELYPELMKYARLAAGTALIGGPKTVESVHAYIILALYPMPPRRWEDDRTWLYLGLAIRVATDLNLHHPPTATPRNEQHAREMLNRSRAWINCFNLDRSTGSQYGKSPIIPNHDYVANHSEFWWRSSELNMKNFDIQTCGYNAELRCLARFRAAVYSDPNHPTLLNKDADIGELAINADDELCQLWSVWDARLKAHVDPGDAQGVFRSGLMSLAYSYARLCALSFGFQHAFGKSGADPQVFVERCLRAASDVVTGFNNNLGTPTNKIFLRHGPEAQSVFVTFACAFLVKLLHPRYAAYLSAGQRQGIRERVRRIVDLLGSPDVAIDERHGPKLYARFLEGLLATPLAQAEVVAGARRSPAARKMKTASPLPLLPEGPGQSYFPPQPSLGMHVEQPTFFNPPLAFDDDLMRTLQSVDQGLWTDDMGVMPGFGWMDTFPQADAGMNMNMNSGEPNVFGMYQNAV